MAVKAFSRAEKLSLYPSRALSPRRVRFFVAFALILFLLYMNASRLQAALQYHSHPSTDAYVFYATRDEYACSAVVNMHRMRHEFGTTLPIIVLVSDDVSSAYTPVFESLGGTVIRQTPPPMDPDSYEYYKNCLLKLLAFKIHKFIPSINRVFAMDADQLVLQNLDSVFDSPATDVSMAPAYWVSRDFLSSTAMLIKPSPELWETVNEGIEHIGRDTYDMDLINKLFGETASRLSPSFAILNSHWNDRNVPLWFDSEAEAIPNVGGEESARSATDDELEELEKKTRIVHFSSVSKPWELSLEEITNNRPDAHPIFLKQWAEWGNVALEMCPGAALIS